MNENLYIGEDHDFFYRLNEKFNNLKIYFAKNVFVYHEDREFKFFLMQRLCYGLNVFTSKNTKIKRIFALMPALFQIFTAMRWSRDPLPGPHHFCWLGFSLA